MPSIQPSYAVIVNATQKTKIVASDKVAYARFGVSVSMYGNMLAVGAWGDDTGRGDVPVRRADITHRRGCMFIHMRIYVGGMVRFL